MSESQLIALPLDISVSGKVIASNVREFREAIKAALKTINADLRSDEQFGQAELDAKGLKAAEDAVRGAKARALADAEQLHALFTELDDTAEEIRNARLVLERQIAKRKDEVKAELIEEALRSLPVDFALAKRTFGASVENAIKGKRTLDSMRKALHVTVTTHAAEIGEAKKILDAFEASNGREMTMDRRDLEVKRPDQVNAELQRRQDVRKADDERKKAEAEAAAARAEAAKLKAEAAEAAKPPLPPVIAPSPSPEPAASSPTPPAGDDSAAEWESFKAAVTAAFAPIKGARAALVHESNKAKAAAFAEAVGKAWKEAQ